MVAAKNASPLVLGLGEGENFVASDATALLAYTRNLIFLEDGDLARLTASGVTVTGFDGKPRERPPRRAAGREFRRSAGPGTTTQWLCGVRAVSWSVRFGLNVDGTTSCQNVQVEHVGSHASVRRFWARLRRPVRIAIS